MGSGCAQGKCHWATRQLGPVLTTKRNQGEPWGEPGKEPDAEQEGPAPASLPPQQWVPGQMCPWKTDVLWP